MNLKTDQRGFTLLEVIITLGILVTLIMAVAQLMRNTFDVRQSLSTESRATQAMNTALQRLAEDLSHAYLLNRKDLIRAGGAERTVFKIGKETDGPLLAFSYLGHQSVQKDAKESELSYVVYQLKASDQFPGRRNLYRGELPRIPEHLANSRDLPPMELFATNIASVQLDPWLGDDWGKDGWDSTHGDQDNKLPAMVRIVVRGWSGEPPPTAAGETESAGEEAPTLHYSTVVYLPFGVEFNSVKSRFGSFRL